MKLDMKLTSIKMIAFLALFVLMFFTSCNDDESQIDIPPQLELDLETVNATIVECEWVITYLLAQGNDITLEYADYTFSFNVDETFVATDGTTTHLGIWVAQQVNTGEIVLAISATTFTNEINDFYFITSLDVGVFHLEGMLFGLEGESEHILTLEKDCDL
ncbi:hypothetical protein A9Q86_06665 [Flavobacteriales bacterium 33_180_T64]|nr:hypothetical protein A9Q86_06665 [Flavobacteriales bacterium 33_180_T64]